MSYIGLFSSAKIHLLKLKSKHCPVRILNCSSGYVNRIVVQEEELLAPAMIPEGHLQKFDLFKLTYQMCCIYFPATSHLWWHTDMHIRVEEQAALILCGLNYIENISLKSEQYFVISRRCTLRTRRT